MGKVTIVGGKVGMKKPVVGVFARNLAVGSTVYLIENNAPAEYLVVHQGKPSSTYNSSCDGTWLLRKDIWYSSRLSSSRNGFMTSEVIQYLVGYADCLLTQYNRATQESLLIPKIPYTDYNGPLSTSTVHWTGMKCRIFIPALAEVNGDTAYQNAPVDGHCLSYFENATNAKRVAKLNGAAKSWWLRSHNKTSNTSQWAVKTDGDTTVYSAKDSYGIRPAVIINKDTVFDHNGIIIGVTTEPHDVFNVDGVYYKVDSGMTWNDWLISDYNVDCWELDDDGMVCTRNSFDPIATSTNSQRVYGDDFITVGGTYHYWGS